MSAVLLDQSAEITAEMIGPLAPPTADEILGQVAELDESTAKESLRALGRAAVAIHYEALGLSQNLEEQFGTVLPVCIPASAVDGRIVDAADIYLMSQARKKTGRRLARDPNVPNTYSIVEL